MIRRRRAPAPSRWALTAASGALALALLACEPGTVAISFTPEVGDEFRFASTIGTRIERTIEGETERRSDRTGLTLEETVTDVTADTVEVSVTVTRDGTAPRSFDVRLDRTGRLAGIVLVEGVPTEALGLDLGADLPPGIVGPPAGPLEPGARWRVDELVDAPGIPTPMQVRGIGEIVELGVEDGNDVAIADVILDAPVRAVIENADGRVTLTGRQQTHSIAAYDLADGALRRERTRISGRVDVTIDPPEGVAAPALRGAIDYRIEAVTTRQ